QTTIHNPRVHSLFNSCQDQDQPMNRPQRPPTAKSSVGHISWVAESREDDKIETWPGNTDFACIEGILVVCSACKFLSSLQALQGDLAFGTINGGPGGTLSVQCVGFYSYSLSR